MQKITFCSTWNTISHPLESPIFSFMTDQNGLHSSKNPHNTQPENLFEPIFEIHFSLKSRFRQRDLERNNHFFRSHPHKFQQPLLVPRGTSYNQTKPAHRIHLLVFHVEHSSIKFIMFENIPTPETNKSRVLFLSKYSGTPKTGQYKIVPRGTFQNYQSCFQEKGRL